MNKVIEIFKLTKKIPKDIIIIIVSFLYYQRNEIFFRNIHFEKTQYYINILIKSIDSTIIYPSIRYFYTENEIRKRFMFHYEIDYEDFIKANRNYGHTRYNNALRISIQCYFCFCCGNYIKKTELIPYQMKIICQCERKL